MSYYIKALRKYAVFSGRADRPEFWYFILVSWLVQVGFGFVDRYFGTYTDQAGFNGLYTNLYILAILCAGLAVLTRRLHDTGRSGWTAWLLLIPVIGWVVVLVFAGESGNIGDNRFGPDPKQGHMSASLAHPGSPSPL